MKSAIGRWVRGSDFFDRKSELQILERMVRERNHVLLTGQRRMGKTSVVRELGRRLEAEGWIFVFTDVEGSDSAADVIEEIAKAVPPLVRSGVARFLTSIVRLFTSSIEEISVPGFRMKSRRGLDARTWRRRGERLLRDIAAQDKPALLVIDELPIFLKRMIDVDGNVRRVDEFLSWLRGVHQTLGKDCPVFIVSGSIGLEPLVRRLGMPDRINHLHPYRLGPWGRDISVECFERLAQSDGLSIEHDVAGAVFDRSLSDSRFGEGERQRLLTIEDESIKNNL